jgi:hypothetical protein
MSRIENLISISHTHKVPYKIRDECKNSNIDYTERYYTKTRTSERYATHTVQKLTDRIIVSSSDPLWKTENSLPLSAKNFQHRLYRKLNISTICNLHKRRHYTKTRTAHTLQKLTDRITVSSCNPLWKIHFCLLHGIMFHTHQRKGAPWTKPSINRRKFTVISQQLPWTAQRKTSTIIKQYFNTILIIYVIL